MGSGKGGAGGGGGGGAPTSEPAPPAQAADEVLDVADEPSSGVIAGKGQLAEELPLEQREVIRHYTGLTSSTPFTMISAEDLNFYLRGGHTLITAAEAKLYKQYQKELNKNLSKIRSYRGDVYRVIQDKSGTIASKYSPGNIVKQNDFLSTSRSRVAAVFPYDRATRGKTRFKIQSKTGKPIEKISNHPREHEVLFRSGTSFKVTSKTWNTQQETWDITLTEL